MLRDFFMNTIVNPLIKLLIRTPLHKLVDDGVVLITYTGRKSGKTITVPVNYLQVGHDLHIISFRSRNWWRNIKGGASVDVQLKGKRRSGWAVLVEKPLSVAKELDLFCRRNPDYANHLGLEKIENGKQSQIGLLKAAREQVAVKITLS
jgi:deazaflavin-dependent oxidoreductase (nitroreductase family)